MIIFRPCLGSQGPEGGVVLGFDYLISVFNRVCTTVDNSIWLYVNNIFYIYYYIYYMAYIVCIHLGYFVHW